MVANFKKINPIDEGHVQGLVTKISFEGSFIQSLRSPGSIGFIFKNNYLILQFLYPLPCLKKPISLLSPRLS
jgi:hypothetical protein